MILKKELDDRIVVFGMSCAGKTTFSKQLLNHHYYCFDAMFHWHLIESLGLSVTLNLEYIQNKCNQLKFVIDGWNLSDAIGNFFPSNSTVYVVYAPYEQIVKQYRIPVLDFNEFRSMYEKWYQQIDYKKFKARYFYNTGNCFIEKDSDDFLHITQKSSY